MRNSFLTFSILCKSFFISLLVINLFACNAQKSAEPWTASELGTFKDITIDKIPQAQAQKLIRLLTKSKIIDMGILSHETDFTSFYTVQSLMSDPRAYFYLSDISEEVTNVSCRLDAVDDYSSFPLIKVSGDQGKILEINNTRKSYYDISFELESDQITYTLQSIQDISAAQQQSPVFKEIMSAYNRSANMRLPKTTLLTIRSMSMELFKNRVAHKLEAGNIDTTYFYLKDQVDDTLFCKSPGMRHILFNNKGLITEKALDPVSYATFEYYSTDQLKSITNYLPVSRGSDSLQAHLQRHYFYSQEGLLDSSHFFNRGSSRPKTTIYQYRLSESDKGNYHIAIEVGNHPYHTDIYFDKQMNWIQIKKKNGEVNRRISYH